MLLTSMMVMKLLVLVMVLKILVILLPMLFTWSSLSYCMSQVEGTMEYPNGYKLHILIQIDYVDHFLLVSNSCV